jgi:hypothetical protein
MKSRAMLVEYLTEVIQESVTNGEGEDAASWNGEGILLSRAEARVALGALLILVQQDRDAGRAA